MKLPYLVKGMNHPHVQNKQQPSCVHDTTHKTVNRTAWQKSKEGQTGGEYCDSSVLEKWKSFQMYIN